MANWVSKLSAVAIGELMPGEEIAAAVFVQPAGTATRIATRHVGGRVAASIASRMSGTAVAPLITDVGTAAKLPDRALVIGLTDIRLIVYGHAMRSGAPRGLQLILPRTQLVRVDAQPQAASWATVFHFADGTASVFEAPRPGNDLEAFVDAVELRAADGLAQAGSKTSTNSSRPLSSVVIPPNDGFAIS